MEGSSHGLSLQPSDSLVIQKVRTGGQEDRRTGGQEVRRTGGQEDRRTGGQALRSLMQELQLAESSPEVGSSRNITGGLFTYQGKVTKFLRYFSF